mgnify:CR=1 FL=1|tara:strand:+ start:4111 stop:4251 length:141 start_codon:yes stop_codon:yes gene_type:complete
MQIVATLQRIESFANKGRSAAKGWKKTVDGGFVGDDLGVFGGKSED